MGNYNDFTNERERALKLARRKMSRYVFRIFRHKQEGRLEPWDNYMRRYAKQVDEIACTFNMEDRVAQFRRRKWAFAGRHGKLMTDGLNLFSAGVQLTGQGEKKEDRRQYGLMTSLPSLAETGRTPPSMWTLGSA